MHGTRAAMGGLGSCLRLLRCRVPRSAHPARGESHSCALPGQGDHRRSPERGQGNCRGRHARLRGTTGRERRRGPGSRARLSCYRAARAVAPLLFDAHPCWVGLINAKHAEQVTYRGSGVAGLFIALDSPGSTGGSSGRGDAGADIEGGAGGASGALTPPIECGSDAPTSGAQCAPTSNADCRTREYAYSCACSCGDFCINVPPPCT